MTDLAHAPYQIGEIHEAERQVERLKRENEELRDRLSLYEDPDPTDWALRLVLGIRVQEARLLRGLMKRSALSSHSILLMCAKEREDASWNLPKVLIYRLRKALRPHGIIIETITSEYGSRYRISPEHIATLKRMEADHG